MLELTFDREARSLYCYFTDINPDEDDSERQLPGVWLLNAEGQILGIRIETNNVSEKLASFAQKHAEVQIDDTHLTVMFSDQPIAEELALEYDALVDFDKKGRALGFEVPAMIDFNLGERLELLGEQLVDVFDEEEEAEPEEIAEPEPKIPLNVQFNIELDADPDLEPVDKPTNTPTKREDIPAPLVDPNEKVSAGFVALVGKPNVGKSTLMNTILGQKVSIVSPKPQTTRVPVRGILNNPIAQIVFIDTPGIHKPRHKLGSFMVEVARRAIPDSDLICFMVDISEPPNRMDREIVKLVMGNQHPKILLLNKVDITKDADVNLQTYRELGIWDAEVAISAKQALGIETLLEEIVRLLPKGPRLYPEDQLSDVSERELVGELIREKVMLNTEQEIPHSIAVEVEEWEPRGDTLYIRANISVERDSQKGILIGSGGTMLRKIGAAARFEIERTLEQHVYLDLWVKVRENWRQKPNQLRWLGYDVKFFRG